MDGDTFLVGVFILAFCIFSAQPEDLAPVKTIYFASCSDWDYSIHDCPKYVNTYEMRYRVLISQQEVISDSVFWVATDWNCNVFDEDNWICENSTGNRKSVSDGRFSQKHNSYVKKGKYAPKEGKDPYYPSIQQISWIEYKIRRLLGWL